MHARARQGEVAPDEFFVEQVRGYKVEAGGQAATRGEGMAYHCNS